MIKKNIDDATITEWIDLYENKKLSTCQIGKSYNVGSSIVHNRIKNRTRIRPKGESRTITFSLQEVINIIQDYSNRTPMHIIGEKYNCCEPTIKKLLLSNNIEIRDSRDSKMKYRSNDNFFKNQAGWTQKHAYFLGWLMSDGHHSPNKRYISIKLQERDKKILEILKDIIEYSGPLTYQKRNGINDFIRASTKSYQNSWQLRVGNKTISEDLTVLGIDNHKTNNLIFPKYLRDDLIPHYLRSFYEGDGTISYSIHKERIMFCVHVIATPDFCESTKKILKDKLNIDAYIVPAFRVKNGNVILKFHGNESSIKFFNYIYNDAKFVLRRKFKKFLRLINFLKRLNYFPDTEIGQNNLDEINKAALIALDVARNAQY